MRMWLQRPGFYVPLFVLVACGWGLAVVNWGWSCNVNAGHAGLRIVGTDVAFVAAVRWGWPSEAWIDREPLRASGQRFGDWLEEGGLLGFGVLQGRTEWYGTDTITVRHVGVALPWWYLAMLAVVTPGEMAAKALWRRRRSERRRRAGQCQQCGYDRRATPERCPECGSVPPEFQNS